MPKLKVRDPILSGGDRVRLAYRQYEAKRKRVRKDSKMIGKWEQSKQMSRQRRLEEGHFRKSKLHAQKVKWDLDKVRKYSL